MKTGLCLEVIDHHRDGFVLLEASWRIERVNAAIERLIGRHAEDLVGCSLAEFCAPQRELDRVAEALFAADISERVHLNWRRADGNVVVTECTFHRYLDDREGRVRLWAFVRDVSRYRQAENALLQREEELRSLFERTQLGKALCVPSGRLIRANSVLCGMLGYAHSDLMQFDLVDLVRPADRPGVRQALNEARAGQLSDWQRELRFLRRDGSEFNGRLLAATVFDNANHPLRVVCEIEDLSEFDRLNELLAEQRDQLAHVSRVSTLGELAAGIAHELNQPLTAIANFATTAALQLERDQNAAAADLLKRIEDLAMESGEIIRRLRQLSTKTVSNRKPTEIDALVEMSLTLMRSDPRVRGLSLRYLPETPGLVATIDSVQIQQVLVNLLRNAVDALRGSDARDGQVGAASDRLAASVVVESESRRDWLILRVRDNGPGVPEALRPRIFEPFVSGKPAQGNPSDNAAETVEPGMGMGLAISDTIVRHHGGRISYRDDVAEDGQPNGACFEIKLPIQHADARPDSTAN